MRTEPGCGDPERYPVNYLCAIFSAGCLETMNNKRTNPGRVISAPGGGFAAGVPAGYSCGQLRRHPPQLLALAVCTVPPETRQTSRTEPPQSRRPSRDVK